MGSPTGHVPLVGSTAAISTQVFVDRNPIPGSVWGTRYVVIGNATDQRTPVGVVPRFIEHDQILIITVYEIK